MTQQDIVFLVLVVGLPTIVAIQLFRNEPVGRPFIATYVLAVIGSSILFMLAALILALAEIGGLGMFDGVFTFIVSVPTALVVGLVVRHRRRKSAAL
jgi:hypothetical protein